MNIIYRELCDRIRGAIPDLDRVVERTMRAWPRAKEPSEVQDVYLDAVALNLHGFYSGLERLFELIARRLDNSLPSGEVWHRDLLFQMGREIQGLRPAGLLHRPGHFVAVCLKWGKFDPRISPLLLFYQGGAFSKLGKG